MASSSMWLMPSLNLKTKKKERKFAQREKGGRTGGGEICFHQHQKTVYIKREKNKREWEVGRARFFSHSFEWCFSQSARYKGGNF